MRADYFDKLHPERLKRKLVERLEALGYEVTLLRECYRCHECLFRSLLKRSDLLDAIRPTSRKRPEERRRAWLRTRREILLWGGGIIGFLMILYYLIRDTGPKQDQL